jgi:hypothetical protein
MTYKIVPFYSKIDDSSSLEDIDAEHFAMSVRERIQVAVQAKAKGNVRGYYFLNVISDVADELLVEGLLTAQDRLRADEVASAQNEMNASFATLWKLVSGNPAAEAELVNLMWGPFMIGLACDREGLDRSEAKKLNDLRQGELMRQPILDQARENWAEVDTAVQAAAAALVSSHPEMNYPPKSGKSVALLKHSVEMRLGQPKDSMSNNSILNSIGRLWPPRGLRGRRPKGAQK